MLWGEFTGAFASGLPPYAPFSIASRPRYYSPSTHEFIIRMSYTYHSIPLPDNSVNEIFLSSSVRFCSMDCPRTATGLASPSFPRRRESIPRAPSCHTPAVHPVIPAAHPVIPLQSTHVIPTPSHVIPAKAGICPPHPTRPYRNPPAPILDIPPLKTYHLPRLQTRLPTFRCKPPHDPPTPPARARRGHHIPTARHVIPAPSHVIPAKAGIQRQAARDAVYYAQGFG